MMPVLFVFRNDGLTGWPTGTMMLRGNRSRKPAAIKRPRWRLIDHGQG
jgi:hypothetical protein